MHQVFDITPRFERLSTGRTLSLDLVSNLGFNRDFVSYITKINSHFHFCVVRIISDTHVRFILNRGENEKDFRCVLALVFVIVTHYKDIDQIWEAGLDRLSEIISQTPVPGIDSPQDEKNRETVDKVVKIIINSIIYSSSNLNKDLSSASSNLNRIEKQLQEFASTEDFFVKTFCKSDIKKAKSLLVEITQLRQEISKAQTAYTEPQRKITEFLNCNTLSGSIDRKEILDAQETMFDLYSNDKCKSKSKDVYYSARRLLKEYDIYVFWI